MRRANEERAVITGMSVITTLGDTLDELHEGLLGGKSGISRWKNPLYAESYSKIGGDLSEYNIDARFSSLRGRLPKTVAARTEKLLRNSHHPLALAMLVAADAFLDSGLFDAGVDPERIAMVLAGPYHNDLYRLVNWRAFDSGSQASDPLLAVRENDTDMVGSITEMLAVAGPAYSVCGACAAGIIGLRSAIDEIRQHDAGVALIVAPVNYFSPAALHSLAYLGAISTGRFDDEPTRASRPFDADRSGFVSADGCAAMIIEGLGRASARGARIYAEIAGIGINSNACRNPAPLEDRTADVMARALSDAGIEKEKIDYISAHATSTKVGDLNEARAIRRIFGDHGSKLKVNALKSMLGHQLGASSLVELVAAILQMRAGVVYPTINVERPDPEIGLDICANGSREYRIDCLMKNAFGFGGINTSCIIRRCP